jgi:ABC-type antimicrobial peptide transport system permease subunit
MVKNLLKISLRNLLKYKVHTTIGILGLAIGIAAMVWAFQNYRYSLGFDDFQEHKDIVYRAMIYKETTPELQGVFPLPAVQLAKDEFSSIEDFVRINYADLTIKTETGKPFVDGVLFADPAFFDFFTFPTLAGTNNLLDQSAVLISELTAKKFFGNTNPIGQTIYFYVGMEQEMPLRVEGVLKNAPTNSTIRFDFITHFKNERYQNKSVPVDDWREFVNAAFFRISNPDDAQRLETSFNRYLNIQHQAREDWRVSRFKLLSLRDHAKLAQIDNNILRSRPENSAAYGPLFLAMLLLLASCMNFANIAVANSNRRLKEIGVRKVMGSTVTQIRQQMFLESGVIVFLGILVSLGINEWWLPTFNEMFVYVDVQANYLNDPKLSLFLLALLVGVSLLAGAYPAMYLSRFNTAQLFKSSLKFGGTNLFSRILLGAQIAISTILVIAGIGFSTNSKFHLDYDYGYDKNNVLVIPTDDVSSYTTMKNAISNWPEVANLAGSSDHIGFNLRQKTIKTKNQDIESIFLAVGNDYLKTMDLKLLEGRDFYQNSSSDVGNSILVTENLLPALTDKPDDHQVGSLGRIKIDTTSFNVIGVVKDFNSSQLFDPIQPVVFVQSSPDRYNQLIVKAAPGQINELMDKARAQWYKLQPLKPFQGYYQNGVAAEAHQVTTGITKTFMSIATLSLFLTVAGLFALLSLTVLKKMKEIAVRKVVGATSADIALVISRVYLPVLFLGLIIGSAVGYLLTKLLLDLIFVINAGLPTIAFALAISTVVAIIALTLAVKVMGTNKMQPAKILQNE